MKAAACTFIRDEGIKSESGVAIINDDNIVVMVIPENATSRIDVIEEMRTLVVNHRYSFELPKDK